MIRIFYVATALTLAVAAGDKSRAEQFKLAENPRQQDGSKRYSFKFYGPAVDSDWGGFGLSFNDAVNSGNAAGLYGNYNKLAHEFVSPLRWLTEDLVMGPRRKFSPVVKDLTWSWSLSPMRITVSKMSEVVAWLVIEIEATIDEVNELMTCFIPDDQLKDSTKSNSHEYCKQDDYECNALVEVIKSRSCAKTTHWLKDGSDGTKVTPDNFLQTWVPAVLNIPEANLLQLESAFSISSGTTGHGAQKALAVMSMPFPMAIGGAGTVIVFALVAFRIVSNNLARKRMGSTLTRADEQEADTELLHE